MSVNKSIESRDNPLMRIRVEVFVFYVLFFIGVMANLYNYIDINFNCRRTSMYRTIAYL